MNLTAKNKWILIIFSAVAGFINGFLGGGGGVVIVTLMLAVLKLHQKYSQATALLVILPLTFVSALVYLVKGNVDWIPTLWATLGVVAGGIVGALLLSKLNGTVAKILFALVLIAGGIKLFF